jgi:hypothetical protein
MAEGTTNTSDLRRVASDLGSMLRTKVTRDAARGVAGWHNNFAPGRIGTTGSALPLGFLRSLRAIDRDLDAAVVNGLLQAQLASGGWSILSLNGSATVEGTVPPLAAMCRSTGPGAGQSVARARAWLEQQQRQDGGWGSTDADDSRVCLTARALMALAALDVPDQNSLTRGAEWLTSLQNGDGSWGPVVGARGTTVHTALAMRGLIGAGVGLSERSIERGLDFLASQWEPSLDATLVETYDATIGPGTYSRVSMVHDIDAEVALCLIETDPLGLRTRLWTCAQGWISANSDQKWWEHMDPAASLWTVIPRATAALSLANRIGTSESTVRWGASGFAATRTPNRRALIALVFLAFRTQPQWFRVLGVALFAAIGIACLVLFFLDIIDAAGLFIGLVVPSILAASQVLITRKE